MKEIRVQFVESDVEHVIAGQTPCKQGEHHIEIITNGCQKLVFIDGKRLHRVLDIDVPLTAGEISPAITIKLHSALPLAGLSTAGARMPIWPT